MQNNGLDEAQDGINIAGRNTNNLRYADEETTARTTHVTTNCSKVGKGTARLYIVTLLI